MGGEPVMSLKAIASEIQSPLTDEHKMKTINVLL